MTVRPQEPSLGERPATATLAAVTGLTHLVAVGTALPVPAQVLTTARAPFREAAGADTSATSLSASQVRAYKLLNGRRVSLPAVVAESDLPGCIVDVAECLGELLVGAGIYRLVQGLVSKQPFHDRLRPARSTVVRRCHCHPASTRGVVFTPQGSRTARSRPVMGASRSPHRRPAVMHRRRTRGTLRG